MAAIEITISGVIFDKLSRTTRPVVLIGEASLTGLGVGGGPMPPGEGGGDSGLHPEHPIYYPPTIWPSPGRPAHPIVLPPDKPTDPPTEPPTNPPDPAWEWGWNPKTGWIPVYTPGDKPQPPLPLKK